MLVRLDREARREVQEPHQGSIQLIELITPRTNGASYTPMAHVFAALARHNGVSLEIVGDATGRRFYARVAEETTLRVLESHLSAAYPQIRMRAARRDPARQADDEQVASCRLVLREPDYLPLRIPRDSDVDADRAPQTDPLIGVLAALGTMPPGWRAVCQLVLQPAPPDWARRHLRRSLEHALAPERAELSRSASQSVGWGGVLAAMAFPALVVLGPRLWGQYAAHGWLGVAPLGVGLAAAVGGLYVLWLRLSQRSLYDVDLVKEKLNHPAARAELRLAVIGPATITPPEVQRQLQQLASAYHAYDLERGNGLVARPVGPPRGFDDLCKPTPIVPASGLPTLSTRELAALWHLVQSADDVALVERTRARRFLPLPDTVGDGGRIGVAEDGTGRNVPVHLAPAVLRRHALLVAKTRKGKSGLLARMWQQLLELPGEHSAAVVLVDPHSDLANEALGLVPAVRQSNVVHLDVSRAGNRPFGLNLLDVGLGWSRDQLVENALRVFKHEFDNYWGPRMELVFRMALLLLVHANERLVRADPSGGRNRQYTILEVPRVVEDDLLRGRLLASVHDPQIVAMWRTYFRPLDHRFRLEIINPVQTKVYKFAANEIARSIVGQSRSTIDPLAWVRDGALVVVDVAKEHVGPDIAAMLGGTLVNLVAMAIGQQASLPANERRHVALLVDEFHALPAANYEAFLAELSKYGASVVLATQSLGALDAVDPQRALRHAVFANVDHLLAFNSSAEDARLLALELGTPIEVAELDEIGDYQCYARLSCDGERLPAFHLRLDAPPIGDSVVRDVLAAASAARYGRDAAAVASDRAALLDQLEPPTGLQANSGNGRSRIDPGAGRIPPASAGTVMEPLAFRAKSKRSEKRPRKQSGAVPEGELPQLELGFGQAEFVPSDLETTPGTNSNDAPQ